MLDQLNRPMVAAGAMLLALALSGCAAQQGRPFPAGGHGLVTPYTVTLRHFASSEALDIMDVMTRDFPGYRSHTLMSSDSATRRYSYVTSAQPHKMEEWLTILLGDMNLNPDKDVNIVIQGTEITVEKLVPTSARPRSPDGNVRFNRIVPRPGAPDEPLTARAERSRSQYSARVSPRNLTLALPSAEFSVMWAGLGVRSPSGTALNAFGEWC